MIKKFILSLLLCLLTFTKNVKALENQNNSFAQFDGKKIAVVVGTNFDQLAKEKLPKSEYVYLNTFTDAISALSKNKVDGVIIDKPMGINLTKIISDFSIFPEELAPDDYAFAVKKGNQKLLNELNRAIRELKKDHSLYSIQEIWLGRNESLKNLPEKPKKINGSLKIVVDAESFPFVYYRNNEIVGATIHVLYEICRKLGYEIEINVVDPSAKIASLESGKSDVAAGYLSITEERKERVSFTDIEYNSAAVLLINTPNPFAKFDYKKTAIIKGSFLEKTIKEKLSKAEYVYFDTYSDAIEALNKNIISSIAIDKNLASNLLKSIKNFSIHPGLLNEETFAFAVAKNNNILKEKINGALSNLKKQGKIDDIQKKWIENESKNTIFSKPYNNKSNVLKVGVSTNSYPFVYLNEKNEIVGATIELLYEIGKELNYNIELKEIPDLARTFALENGNIDLIAGTYSITNVKNKYVSFTIPEYLSTSVLIVNENNFSENYSSDIVMIVKKETFFDNLKKSFIANFIREDRYKMVLQGIKITLIISIFTILFGMFFGMIVCAMRRSKNKIINSIAKTYIRILQGTPILVLLMIMFYIVFAKTELSPIIVAIMAFGLNSAAYCAEIFRTGIDSIDKGQKEASLALGFNNIQTFMLIFLPQTTKHVIPVLKGEFVSTVKSTSIVGYIAIQDLTKVCDIIRSRTYDAFFPLIASAIIYFTMTYILTVILSFIEFKLDPKQRKRIVKGCTNND